MRFLAHWLPQIVIAAGLWTSINGILHTIFVLVGEHGRQYSRVLLRLLTDGLLLVTFGLILLLCFSGIQEGNNWAFWIAILACTAVIIYCLLIWPFLKSVATSSIHTLTLVWLVLVLLNK